MKKILCISFILSLFLVSGAFAAGSWFDDFENYADQTALEASDWNALDGKADGILDSTNHFIRTQSMRCEQYPVETRPTRKMGNDVGLSTGTLSLWFYDDGADIKSFDIRVSSPFHYVALGLRDDQVGVDTEYTCNKDGVVINTGVTRSTGWHVFLFNANVSSGTDKDNGLPYELGTEMLIDAQRFPGNVLDTMTLLLDLTIYTNLGNATDQNAIWVDSIQWLSVGAVGMPKQTRMGNISLEFQPPVGTTEWQEFYGSATEVTNKPDGIDPTNYFLDAYDELGYFKGFYYKGTMTVPRTAYYVFECPYQNGPTWDTHNPWPDLTFKVGDTEFHEGSTTTGGTGIWAYVGAPGKLNWYYRTHAPLIGGDTISIEVTGDPLSPLQDCFVRLARCELLYVRDYAPPPITAVQNAWNLYE
ncbi:hypothetical protein JW926_16930 [Candidatus Sumerlaeota bacterium]|nr:hypothetical protein [Candidatus Sumerlaeota bacterium]